MKTMRLVLVLLAIFATASLCKASNLDPRLQMSQYGHRIWRVQDGSLPGEPSDMVQTSDGYLWLSTSNGLVRFDGVTFKTWRELTGDATQIPAVVTLAVSGDGTLWIGSYSGLYKIAPHATKMQRILPGRINAIQVGTHGDVWAVRSRLAEKESGALCRLAPEPRCFDAKDGVHYPYGTALALAPDGEPWMGSSQGISVGVGAGSREYVVPQLVHSKGLAGITAIIADNKDDAWVGTAMSGLGLLHLQHGRWTSIPIGGDGAGDVSIASMYRCTSGELFIATEGQGLYRVIDGKAEHYGLSTGLSSDSVNRIFEDSEKNLWVMTQEGLDEFYPARVAHVSRRNGVLHGTASTVIQRKNGDIWVGDHDRIDIITSGTTHAERSIMLPGKQVTGLFADREDHVWAGLDQDLVILNGDHPNIVKEGVGIIQNIRQDDNGTLWFVTAAPDHKVFQKLPGRDVQPVEIPLKKRALLVEGRHVWYFDSLKEALYSQEHGLSSLPHGSSHWFGAYSSAFRGSHGIWIAARNGEALFHDGSFRLMTKDNGLACAGNYMSAEDHEHNLWIMGPCGIQMVHAADIERWLVNDKEHFAVDLYGPRDGSVPQPTTFDQGQLVSQDGRVWFATESELLVIDPSQIDKIKVSAPTAIQSVSADHREIFPADNLKIPARTHDLEISYASLNFREADRMNFRYRLLPYDSDWVEAGDRRVAYYTGVPPGHYRFEVATLAPHSQWSVSPLQLNVDVQPAYYQTLWFRVLVILLIVGTTVLAFRVRVRHATADMQRRMDTQMAERIRIARELHDTILQGFYGMLMRVQSAANKLSKDEPARLSIEKSLDEAETTLRQGRETIRELRGESNTEEDLLSALQTMAGGMALEGTDEVSYRVTGDKRRLHPLVRSELLRIGREALWNALSHASASRIEVVVACDAKGVTLSISDNGLGIDPAILKRGTRDGHWGLRGMQERSDAIGASFQITSTLNVGTRVTLHVPASLAFVQSFGNGFTKP